VGKPSEKKASSAGDHPTEHFLQSIIGEHLLSDQWRFFRLVAEPEEGLIAFPSWVKSSEAKNFLATTCSQISYSWTTVQWKNRTVQRTC